MHEEITAKIIEACFEVSNELGAGFLESVYQKALTIVLQEKGLEAVNEIPIPVYFRGKVIGNFYADLLVEQKVIVELKAVSGLTPEHQAQVINYLKASDLEVGLLINFGRPKIEVKRLHK
jgi:GxxExxY protein